MSPADPTTSPPPRMSRRTLLRTAGALAGAGAAGGLAGCGDGGAAGALSFWQFYSPRGQNPDQVKWFKELVAAWNRDHRPKVELKFLPAVDYRDGPMLQTAFVGDKGPDIFVVSPGDFLRYYNGDVLTDLTPYMTTEEREDFYPELMGTRMVDGRVYALPMGGGPLAIYYNVRAFEKAGLSEGDLPRTWEELRAIARRLTRGRQFGLLLETAPGYYQNFTWYPYLWSAGGQVLPESGASFDGDGTVRALGLWKEFVESGLSPRKPLGNGSSDIVANLGSGYCAMQQLGMNGVADFKAGAPDFEYGVFPIPAPEGAESLSVAGGWAFAANAGGRDPEAAARFCVWAIGADTDESVDRVARWCTEAQTYVPYRRSAMRRADELGAYDSGPMRTFRREIFPGTRGEPRYPPEVQKAVTDSLQECQLGGSSPTVQARKGADRINEILSTYDGPRK